MENPSVSKNSHSAKDEEITLFLSGDVMTGRGIDQILPDSVDPQLHEQYVKSARRYVEIAEQEHGAIPRNVSYEYIWGDALDIFDELTPDLRIINLETTLTTSEDWLRGKGIHYRMHPKNVKLLQTAAIDCTILGNNHVYDWGAEGLRETIRTLEQAGIPHTGVGVDQQSAEQPAVLSANKGRVLIFSYGSPTAGVSPGWRAQPDKPGLNFLDERNTKSADRVIDEVEQFRESGDRVIVSLHWGKNWGYEIPDVQQQFAHALIDSGTVDLIHGHSSHHPKGIEVYKGHPVFYGCGDLINDYEGITRRSEEFRNDLALMYFPALDDNGELTSLTMIPMQIHQMRLRRASPKDSEWLADILNRECGKFGHRVKPDEDGALVLEWD